MEEGWRGLVERLNSNLKQDYNSYYFRAAIWLVLSMPAQCSRRLTHDRAREIRPGTPELDIVHFSRACMSKRHICWTRSTHGDDAALASRYAFSGLASDLPRQ
jgi:hypothetical protein